MMRKFITGISIVGFTFLLLDAGSEPETVNEEQPYCVEVARERSIYQYRRYKNAYTRWG